MNLSGGPTKLICPECKASTRQAVYDSRDHGAKIVRRRRCPCGAKFKTEERFVPGPEFLKMMDRIGVNPVRKNK